MQELAVVGLREPVLGAVVSAAIGALEGKYLLPSALLAPHISPSHLPSGLRGYGAGSGDKGWLTEVKRPEGAELKFWKKVGDGCGKVLVLLPSGRVEDVRTRLLRQGTDLHSLGEHTGAASLEQTVMVRDSSMVLS
jgi:hypothetical protein